MIDAAFVPNPTYGNGIFRRRIRLVSCAQRVAGGLEDNYHAMTCSIEHDGNVVTAIDARFARIPMTTCPGAAEPIRALIGQPLTSDLLAIYRRNSPKLNCTHLFDLTCLAITHAVRGIDTRQYDVEIADERGAPVAAIVRPAAAIVTVDGSVAHSWQSVGGKIAAPEPLTGRPLVAGFMRWAAATFAGEALEAAMVLHRGYFVSNARRFITDDAWMLEPAQELTMRGVCHTYQPGNVEHAVRFRRVVRDFSHRPEDLLSGFDPG
jgi:hypothetical protein